MRGTLWAPHLPLTLLALWALAAGAARAAAGGPGHVLDSNATGPATGLAQYGRTHNENVWALMVTCGVTVGGVCSLALINVLPYIAACAEVAAELGWYLDAAILDVIGVACIVGAVQCFMAGYPNLKCMYMPLWILRLPCH